MTMKLGVAILPANPRTRSVLLTGLTLLQESLPLLSPADQQGAVEPLSHLTHTAGGFPGPLASKPSPEVVALASEVVDEAVSQFGLLGGLPLPTMAHLREVLRQNPWPDDAELNAFCHLLAPGVSGIDDDDVWSGRRATAQAEMLLAANSVTAELQRWQSWLVLASEAGMKHVGHPVIEYALAEAAEQAPGAVRSALLQTIPNAPELAIYCGRALAVLFDGGERNLAETLAAGCSSVARAVVAAGPVASHGLTRFSTTSPRTRTVMCVEPSPTPPVGPRLPASTDS